MRNSKFKKDKKVKKEVTCYNCQQVGHYANKCPLKKKVVKDKKKKALLATWSDSDDEEEANICLMAKDDILTDSDNDEVPSYDELLSAYNSMYTMAKSRRKENRQLKNEIEINEHENLKLRTNMSNLEKTFDKFNISSDNLNNLLSMQRCNFDKRGLGYEKKSVNFSSLIAKAKMKIPPTCTYCCKQGHIRFKCRKLRHQYNKRSYWKWIPKNPLPTNKDGPKEQMGTKDQNKSQHCRKKGETSHQAFGI